MQAKIGISPEHLAKVANSLNSILADEFVLYVKTLKAHWNVQGPDFHSKHIFFEQQYGEMQELIDAIAERIRTLGHFPVASLQEFLNLTHLTEQTRESNDSKGHITDLLNDHESILIRLRENIDGYADALKDAGTSDYITGLMEKHEKMAWMLRAHLA